MHMPGFKVELLIGDQDGTIYRWDVSGEKHVKYVSMLAE